MVRPDSGVEDREVLDADDVQRALTRIAHEVLERNKGASSLVLLGIPTRGVPLAQRLAARISEVEGTAGVAAQHRAAAWIGRLHHEYGLGQVEFACDGLHRVLFKAVGFQHHRQRIAGKARLREDIEGDEPAAHREFSFH